MNRVWESPRQLRREIRDERWTTTTAGQCPGYVQANMIALPKRYADAFTSLCDANPTAFPLIERLDDPGAVRSAPGADLRTDLPQYQVHIQNRPVINEMSVLGWWSDDLVGFLLGCSFTADGALMDAGISLEHMGPVPRGPVFRTSRTCVGRDGLSSRLVVSMRPIKRCDVPTAVAVTAARPLAHGAPVHIGAPDELGIADLAKPDWNYPIAVADGYEPVFWACGVTLHELIRTAGFPLAITHAPAHMFVTDVRDADTIGVSPPLHPTEFHQTITPPSDK